MEENKNKAVDVWFKAELKIAAKVLGIAVGVIAICAIIGTILN